MGIPKPRTLSLVTLSSDELESSRSGFALAANKTLSAGDNAALVLIEMLKSTGVLLRRNEMPSKGTLCWVDTENWAGK